MKEVSKSGPQIGEWDFFDAVYCISLAGRPDRRKTAGRQFKTVGLLDRVEFVIAQKHLTDNEQGIYESHMTCIEKGLAAGADMAGITIPGGELATVPEVVKGLDLAGATEEVQRRAATALLVLADGVGTIDDYTESLDNAAGSSQRMADIQLETLQGKVTILKSAWDRYILTLATSEEQFLVL